MGELLTSHRYDHIPLLDSSPGGFCRSWSYKTHPGTKVGIFYIFAKNFGPMRKKTFRYILFACLACLLVAGVVLRQQFLRECRTRGARPLYRQPCRLPKPHRFLAAPAQAPLGFRPLCPAHQSGRRRFKPGHYVLEPGMSVIRVARMLKLGLQTPVRVSINNARIPAQLAQKLAPADRRRLHGDHAGADFARSGTECWF